MSEQRDEEEGTASGRPNAYFRRLREEAVETGLRGQGQGRPPRAEALLEVHGDYDSCWCGLPAGHDWPGRSSGLAHPKEMPVSAQTSSEAPPRIERSQLKAYDSELTDVILKAVNEYGLRYKLTGHAVMLYPADGSEAFQIGARSAGPAIKQAQRWFVRHVALGHEDAKPRPPKQTDADIEEAARKLREKLVDPEEHPEAPKKANALLAEIPQKVVQWTQYHNLATGEPIPGWLTDGARLKCADCEFISAHEKLQSRAAAMGGHRRTTHDPIAREKMYGRAAQDKKMETREHTVLLNKVTAANKILTEALGLDLASTSELNELRLKVKNLQKHMDQASKSNIEMVRQRDQAVRERDEAKAKLDLLREALGKLD